MSLDRNFPDDFIRKHQPDIIVKGKEFENLDNPEEEILRSYGGKLIFSSGKLGPLGSLLKKMMQAFRRYLELLLINL